MDFYLTTSASTLPRFQITWNGAFGVVVCDNLADTERSYNVEIQLKIG